MKWKDLMALLQSQVTYPVGDYNVVYANDEGTFTDKIGNVEVDNELGRIIVRGVE